MPSFAPFLEIRGQRGCMELGNNCRTLAYINRPTQPRPDRSWRIVGNCPDCCCDGFDAKNYTYPSDFDGNPAPWADPANRASWDFFGLLIDGDGIVLEEAFSPRRRGASNFGSPPGFLPRTLTVKGTIVSNSCRGTNYGLEWLRNQVQGACGGGNCDGFQVRLARNCVDELGEEFISWQPLPAPTLETVGIDPCGDDIGDAPKLDPIPDDFVPQLIADTGFRDLLRVRFVSMEMLSDEIMPCCEGQRVGLVFEVLSSNVYYPTDSQYRLCVEMDQPFDPCRAIPFDWSSCRPEPEPPCGLCGLPCHCDTTTPITLTRPGFSSCYCRPLVEISRSFLTPVLPWSVNAVMLMDIYGGAQGSLNLRVDVREALDGVPSPDTVLGCRIYSSRDVCASAEIAGISPGATLSIDGRLKRVTLRCPGRADRTSTDLVSGPSGSDFGHPVLSCGKRYWITVSADAYNISKNKDGAPDITIKACYVPFEIG